MTWSVVKFTRIELLGCMDLARQRNTKATGVASRKIYTGANDLITNYVAVKGEYAVEKLTGAAMNMDVHANGGGDTHMSVAGHTALIRVSDDLLIFNTPDDFDADIAILVSPFGSERDPFSGEHKRHWRRDVVVKGWIGRDEFLERATERDLGYGMRLCLRDGQLWPLGTLLEPEPVQLALV